MKVGFVVHFFDFRNDVRKVIATLKQTHEVVVFVQEKDLSLVQPHLVEGVEVRLVKERQRTWRNRLWEQFFRIFGKIPKSALNYYLMETFKISLLPDLAVRQKAQRVLEISMKLPKFIAYDTYLDALTYRGETDLQDIDQFICFTDIYDDYIFARLVREQHKLSVYVYSWDHPCKHKRFSTRAKYMVWNGHLRQDVIELQNISPQQVSIVGSSQFAYVKQFLQLPTEQLQNPFPFPYIYFGCAIGTKDLALKEVEVIRKVSEVLWRCNPQLKLVVRPYPALKSWDVYGSLKSLPNIEMDDQYKSVDLSVGEMQIMDKFVRIHFAEAFIHLGTTLGYEACFTRTPSIILDFDTFKQHTEALSVYNFVHQYQNEKYLMLDGYPNVVRSAEELGKLFENLTTGRSTLTSYNSKVTESTPLKSFEEFAGDLLKASD